MDISSEFSSQMPELQSADLSRRLQPPPVDFIDNRLPQYHPQFHPIVKYDHAASEAPALDSGSVHFTPLQQVDKFKLWNTIFPTAMKRLKEQPLIKLGPEFMIRDKTSWEDVHDELQRAQKLYNGYRKGHITKNKKVLVGVVQSAIDHRASAPMAVIKILLEVFQSPASIGRRIKQIFEPEELEATFAHIEFLMITFPEEFHVHDAFLRLVVSILLAIEMAIQVLMKNPFLRGISLLVQNEKYQDKFVENMNQIKTASDTLIREVQTSGIFGGRQALMSLDKDPMKIAANQTQKIDKADVLRTHTENNTVSSFNMVKDLLDEFIETKNRELERIREREYMIDNIEASLRHRTIPPPRAFAGPWQHTALNSPTQISTTPSSWYSSHTRQYLPNYMHNSSYSLYPPLGWHSLSHMRQHLLKHAPRPSGPPRPLIGWYSPYAYQTQQAIPLNSSWLQDVLSIPYSDEKDLERVTSDSNTISPLHIGRADQVESTETFKDWVVQPESKELFVEGNFGSDDCHYISALSLLCSNWTQELRKKEGYISLVFFCGFHGKNEQDDEDENDQDVGGVAMMRSLILQLLKQHHTLDLTGLEKGTKLDALEDGDLDQLCSLFMWILKRLSKDVILVCIIDGVVHYETDDYKDKLLKVMECLLSLSKDDGIRFPVKLLVTSPTPTKMIRELFSEEKEDNDARFISLDSFPEVNHMLEAEPQLYPVPAKDMFNAKPYFPAYSGMPPPTWPLTV